MARRNRSEVVVEYEIGVDHCIPRVVRRAFLCGVDPLTKQSFEHRQDWIRDRLEVIAGFFGVEIANFAVMSNHVHVILRNRPDVVALRPRSPMPKGHPALPEGAAVMITYRVPAGARADLPRTRIQVPLVRTGQLGSLNLTGERIAEILDEEDASP